MGTKIRASGADVSFKGVFETTEGTSPTTGYFSLPFNTHGLGEERPLESDDPILGQGREAQDPSYGDVTVNGSIKMPFDLRNSGFWLKGLLGAPVTTGTGTYTHTFNSTLSVLPSLSLEIGHPQLSSPKFYSHAGTKLGDCEIGLSRSGGVQATINAIARKEVQASSTLDASPTALAFRKFMRGNGSVTVGGSSFEIMSGTLKFSNGLEAYAPITPDGAISGVDEGDFTASGQLVVRFGTNNTIESAIDAETPLAFSFGWTIPSTSYSLTFNLPRVFLPKKKKEVSGPRGVDISYDWQCARDATEGFLLEAVLINDVASY